MVGLIVNEIINIIILYIQIISSVTGIVSLIITFWYNRKLHHYNLQALQLYKKDRERPAIVELIRFFIVPLKEWFSYQMSIDEFEEFDIAKLDSVKFAYIKTLQPPSLELLYMEFASLLEKSNLKGIWDKKIQCYNKLARNLYEKINDELKQGIRKFVEKNQDVERTYEKTKAKDIYITIDAFKKNLVDEFYQQYKNRLIGNALSGTWSFVDEKIFEQAISYNKSILEDIKKLVEEGKHLLNELISFLEQVRKQLREEYNIYPSEQEPLISFGPHRPILRS
ncbi:MAG: hypothetical protein RQ952_07495 [Thermoproteota archaeon]|jgi:hypothetical protein|nr:hypothetical protein [Thermoproteota archaeon]